MTQTAPADPSPIDPPDPRREDSPDSALSVRTAVLLTASYLLFGLLVPLIKTESVYAILASTLVSLAFVIWIAATYARLFRGPRSMAIGSVLLMGVVLPLRFGMVNNHPVAMSVASFLPGSLDLVFILLAATLGGLLSYLLKSFNMIPPVAAVLALVDIWTVLLGGPVQQMMQSKSPAARAVTQVMTVPLPAPSRATKGAAPLNGVIGFADFLFVAFFVVSIGRFVHDPRAYPRTIRGMMAVLALYMLAVFLIDGLQLPALVPMSVVMLCMHWRSFHYERSELFALLYAALFIAAIIGAFWFFARGRAETKRMETGSNFGQPRHLSAGKGGDTRGVRVPAGTVYSVS